MENMAGKTEDEIVKTAIERLIPNRHDLMVMAVFALVVGIVFWAGWEMNPTLTCKVYIGNQMHLVFGNGSNSLLNLFWNGTLNTTIGNFSNPPVYYYEWDNRLVKNPNF